MAYQCCISLRAFVCLPFDMPQETTLSPPPTPGRQGGFCSGNSPVFPPAWLNTLPRHTSIAEALFQHYTAQMRSQFQISAPVTATVSLTSGTLTKAEMGIPLPDPHNYEQYELEPKLGPTVALDSYVILTTPEQTSSPLSKGFLSSAPSVSYGYIVL